MPVVQFSIRDDIWRRLYDLGDQANMSVNLYAKNMLIGMMESLSPSDVAEFKRAYERGSKGKFDDQVKRAKPVRFDE